MIRLSSSKIILALVIAALAATAGCAAKKGPAPTAAAPAPAPAADVMTRYTVSHGDHLWGISSRDDVYSDAYQWPLIYKSNTDRIKDADLIYPDQVLVIPRAMSSADVEAATQHAKNRGAWALGVVEESDVAYLGR